VIEAADREPFLLLPSLNGGDALSEVGRDLAPGLEAIAVAVDAVGPVPVFQKGLLEMRCTRIAKPVRESKGASSCAIRPLVRMEGSQITRLRGSDELLARTRDSTPGSSLPLGFPCLRGVSMTFQVAGRKGFGASATDPGEPGRTNDDNSHRFHA
jgi:hypothetical protein